MRLLTTPADGFESCILVVHSQADPREGSTSDARHACMQSCMRTLRTSVHCTASPSESATDADETQMPSSDDVALPTKSNVRQD
eukprot:6206188-Pleurochrysis_carterae.AAC.1